MTLRWCIFVVVASILQNADAFQAHLFTANSIHTKFSGKANYRSDGIPSASCSVSRSGLRRRFQPKRHQFDHCTRKASRSTIEDDQPQSSKSNKEQLSLSSSKAKDSTKGSSTPPPRYRPGSLMAATAEQGRVPYGESSRQYRRTVYTHDDWIAHRNSEQRVYENLQGIFFSGIVRQLKSEVSLVALMATLVVLWNGLAVPFLQSSTVWTTSVPMLMVPALPFTLSSPALGLLLVFKTNTSYARWYEARGTWSKLTSQSLNLVRMASTFCDMADPVTQTKVQRLATAAWLVCRSVMNELWGVASDEGAYRKDVEQAFASDSRLAQRFVDAGPNRVTIALAEASLALDAIPIDEKRRVEMDKSLVLMGDGISVCQRVFASPVPLVYTRHTSRFLSLWMLLLPGALYETFASSSWIPVLPGLGLIPAVSVVALFLFGIEELAIQLEEPFSILPLDRIVEGVRRDMQSVTDWCIARSTDLSDNEDVEASFATNSAKEFSAGTKFSN